MQTAAENADIFLVKPGAHGIDAGSRSDMTFLAYMVFPGKRLHGQEEKQLLWIADDAKQCKYLKAVANAYLDLLEAMRDTPHAQILAQDVFTHIPQQHYGLPYLSGDKDRRASSVKKQGGFEMLTCEYTQMSLVSLVSYARALAEEKGWELKEN